MGAHITNNPSTVWQTDAEVPVQAANDWTAYPGRNAHARGCGAASELTGNVPGTLEECKEKCIAFGDGCTAITHRARDNACLLRGGTDDPSLFCDTAMETVTYVMSSGTSSGA